MSGWGALRSRTVRLDGPIDLLAALPTPRGLAWIREGVGFVAWGEAVWLDPGSGAGRFTRAADAAASLLAEIEQEAEEDAPGPLVFGSFTFLGDAPGSRLVLPSVVLRWTGEEAWLTVTGRDELSRERDGRALLREVSAPGDPRWAGVAPATQTGAATGNGTGPGGGPTALATPERAAGPTSPVLPEGTASFAPRSAEPPERGTKSGDEWMAAVASARQSIRDGRLLKVVLARDVVVDQVGGDAPFDARVVARRLAGRYPECWTFLCGGLVGATPELLVRREGATISSLTLAGTTRRGDDPEADAQAGRELLASRKDRWEHELAVRFVRDTLTRCCSELWVDPEPSLLRLANVQHLATNTHGLLSRPLSALELAGRLHPGAAICGLPAAEALEVIEELEGMDRGRYAAPVGWMDGNGNGEWAIALRCAELSGSRARLFAGAGIVAESDPESELEETRLKLRPMLSALDAPEGSASPHDQAGVHRPHPA